MKIKLFIIIAVLFGLGTNLNAQKHLRFLDVPINGTLSEFSNNFSGQYKFTMMTPDKSCLALTGTFLNLKNCEITFIGSNYSDYVYSVSIFSPKFYNWDDLNRTYRNLKNAFIDQFGIPKEDIAKFNENPENNNQLLQLNLGECSFYCKWENETGEIRMELIGANSPQDVKKSIEEHKALVIGAYLDIYYIDYQNQNKYDKERILYEK